MQEPEPLPQARKFTLCEAFADEVWHRRGMKRDEVRQAVAEKLREQCSPGNVLVEGRTWIEHDQKRLITYVWAEAYGYEENR